MWSFIFIFFIVPVTGLTIDIARGRFRKKNVAEEVVVSEVGNAPEVMDETPPQQVLPSCDGHGNRSQRPEKSQRTGVDGTIERP